MLRYPGQFVNSDDYKMLKCPKAVVGFVCALQTLEARQKRHEDELAALNEEARKSTDVFGMSERLTSDVHNITHEGVLSPEERTEKLRALLPDIRKAARFGGQIPGRAPEALALAILKLYARFDVDAFHSDITRVVDSSDHNTLAVRIKRAEDNIARAKREIGNHLETTDALFTRMPLSWRGDHLIDPRRNVAPEILEERKRRLASKIVLAFVSDWKARAPLFVVPVTVNGIAISSLPDGTRDAAQAAYAKLKLSELPQRPYFHAVQFAKGETEEVKTPQAPKSMFQRALAAVKGDTVTAEVTGVEV